MGLWYVHVQSERWIDEYVCKMWNICVLSNMIPLELLEDYLVVLDGLIM